MDSVGFRFVIGLAALVVFSSIVSLGANNHRLSTERVAQAGSDGVRRISPDEVRELLRKGKAVLVDVRGEDSYKAGHIKGALLIPLANIGERAGELPKDKTIVTYCS